MIWVLSLNKQLKLELLDSTLDDTKTVICKYDMENIRIMDTSEKKF